MAEQTTTRRVYAIVVRCSWTCAATPEPGCETAASTACTWVPAEGELLLPRLPDCILD